MGIRERGTDGGSSTLVRAGVAGLVILGVTAAGVGRTRVRLGQHRRTHEELTERQRKTVDQVAELTDVVAAIRAQIHELADQVENTRATATDARLTETAERILAEKTVPAIAEAYGEGVRQGRARGFAEGLARARQVEAEEGVR